MRNKYSQQLFILIIGNAIYYFFDNLKDIGIVLITISLISILIDFLYNEFRGYKTKKGDKK